LVLIAFLLRVAVSLVFVRAGLLKMLSRPAFRDALANYRLLPEGVLELSSWLVPLIELASGSLLLLGVELRVVGPVLAALLLVFCAAIAINLLRGRVISCGCSGSVASDISWRHVVLNSAWAGAAIVVAVWAAQPLSLLAGVYDPHQSATWTSDAVAPVLVMMLVGSAALLGVEASRVFAAMLRTNGSGGR
jgi:uncharacterized membrane protein YphA (DoxX/SURF4 family)